VVDVVLDENIYIKAINAECTGEPSDHRAARVVSALQVHHRWIITRDIARAYRRQFSRTRCHGSLPTQLMSSLTEVTAAQTRFLWLEDPPIIEGNYHHKDQHMVAAAAVVEGSYLVTTDMRLVRSLERAGILMRYSFSVVGLDAAEPLLVQQPD
jgi:hypothetical protein